MVFRRVLSSANVVAVLFVTAVFATPYTVSAQIAAGQENAQAVAQAAGIASSTDLITIIGRIINVFLGFLGVVFLVLLLYAGYQWMTSGGDAEKVKKAQVTIRNAVIGLVIIASAWAIVAFVLNALTGITGGGLGGITTGAGPGVGGLRGSSGSLGNGIIEYHLPPRNATGVPRNTPIIITFKEAVDPSSFIQGWTETASGTTVGLNADAVKIYRTRDGESSALATDKARVRYTSDLKTFVIKPVEYLGSPTTNVGYTVTLKGGKSGIRKKDGSVAFAGAFGAGYTWPFEVSTRVDLTPPTVEAATPLAFGSYARNVVIQVTFNKAMDPTAVTGKTSNIEVRGSEPGKTDSTLIPGEFRISNQYRTVEFVPELKCGTNSCGRDVFCLPGSKTIQITAKAATLDPAAKPQAQLTTSGYDGVVDAVGNSLDGNKTSGAEGPPTDNYSWSFGTTDLLKLTPPQIETTIPSTEPGKNSNVPLDQPVQASFDTILQASTLTTENVRIEPRGPGEKNPDTFWWSLGMKLLTASGADISTVTGTSPVVAVKSALVIMHRPYLPSGTGIDKLNFYNPFITSGIQDEYQNCFNPARLCGTGTGVNCCNGRPQDATCAFTP